MLGRGIFKAFIWVERDEREWNFWNSDRKLDEYYLPVQAKEILFPKRDKIEVMEVQFVSFIIINIIFFDNLKFYEWKSNEENVHDFKTTLWREVY